MSLDETAIAAFLESYGAALNAGDIPTVVAAWDLPALVLADQGALSVVAADEVERFFIDTVAYYHARGIALSRPHILCCEALGQRLVSVDARWASLDAAGVELSSETSRYILNLSPDGQWRFRVAIAVTPA